VGQPRATSERDSAERPPGSEAETPAQIPARGWLQVTKRAYAESKADNVSILAGGVAFFAFLALFPAMIAALSVYGLVADPATVADQVAQLAALLPETARPLVVDQLNSVAAGSGGALGIGLIVSVLAALWSASSGTSNLMAAVNAAYDEDETRGFIKLRGTALLLTLGAVVFMLLAVALVAVVPAVLSVLGLGGVALLLAQVLRWVLLVVLVVSALAIVYRVGPDRDAPRMSWVSTGAIVATVLWIVASVLFSLYVSNFGSYNKTYGALAGVVVLMLWLYLTSYLVLLGAEINAESERQTRRDSTVGEEAPAGERGAAAADDLSVVEEGRR